MSGASVQDLERLKEWQQEYERYEASGLTQAEYCESQGLQKWTFKAGIRAARVAGLMGPLKRRVAKVSKRSGFVSVQVGKARLQEPVPAYCEILFLGKPGIRIETEQSMQQRNRSPKPILP